MTDRAPLHTLEDIAPLLGGYRPEYYRRLAHDGVIPGRKIGHKWFFTDADIDGALEVFKNDFSPAATRSELQVDNVRPLAFAATTKKRVAG